MSARAPSAVHREVAALHAASIDRGFLATLGIDFLAQMYAAIDVGPESVLLVEQRDGRVVGFVSGGLRMGPIYRRMMARPLALGCSLAGTLVRPRRVLRILDILRYGRRQTQDDGLPEAELLSLAVDPAYRGQQVSDRLYGRLVEHFRAKGVPAFKITVGAQLQPAHRFYRRMGAEPVAQTEVHAGESSMVYVQSTR